ncbi:Peptidoglycan-binding protein ArfA [Anatilimnocola aggregata]|uniref:Peptidoglycan-binding protein ArfA n=1 Tax=Anatilimnocola aggregata TaxID=2528021 RepID=A0A517YBV0_9BACT|nr:OmpA family protein [Anatilimnocola aggregata]QDU27691.1 Peptidoglycan-binding protein ArfA [Anatilimnocola aggregata]
MPMLHGSSQLRPLTFASLLCALLVASSTGCKQGAFSQNTQPGAAGLATTPAQPKMFAQQQVDQLQTQMLAQQQSLTSQVQDLTRRTQQLDMNNSNLTRELAQAQQSQQQYQEQIVLLQKQLGDTATRLKSEQLAAQESSKQLNALQASTKFRGGASIQANSSVKQALQTISLPGLIVKQDGDVVRIEIPADKLFTPNSAQMTPEASRILDEVASAIARSYSRQRIIIEGHSDNSPDNTVNAHLLTNAQAQLVFQHMVQKNNLPARQLSILAMGENHPLASNGEPAGQAKNRRIEIVVYPDSIDG